jgi:hypothetical protein
MNNIYKTLYTKMHLYKLLKIQRTVKTLLTNVPTAYKMNKNGNPVTTTLETPKITYSNKIFGSVYIVFFQSI